MNRREIIEAAQRTETDGDRLDMLALADEVLGDIEIAERRGTLPPESIDALRGTVDSLLRDLGLNHSLTEA